MYKIYAGEQLIHHPRLFADGYQTIDPTMTQAPNTHGSLTFTIAPDHPLYDGIELLSTIIRVLDDTEELFRGRVVEVTRDFYNRKEVYCEGELAFLCDSYYRPFGFQGSPTELFTALIENHNSQVDEGRQFTVGKITVEDNNDYINRSSVYALSTWEVINTRLIDTLGGYLRIRLEGGVRYIDYLADFDTYSDQVIQFGENLLDLERYVSAADVITCLIPYGAEYEEEDENYTEQPDNGSYNGNRVGIASVNGGVDYVYSETGVALYGYIWGTNVWDDVTEAANLLKKAQAYVDDAILSATTLTIKAVDLHLIDVDTSRIHVGDYVKVLSKPHDTSVWLNCTELKTDLANPEKTEITLGVATTTLTGSIASGSISSSGSGSSGGSSGSGSNADLTELTARVDVIEGDYVTHAEITDLVANTVTVTELTAKVASIETLLAGSAGVGTLQAIYLSSANVKIADATITEAMIAELTASKITSGTLYTSNVRIANDTGENLLIDGSTLTIKDSNSTVRVQIGEDGQSDYNLYLWDAEGTLIWNAQGLTAEGLGGNGAIIKDMHVADDAAISGEKLNITSVAEKLNEDGSITVSAAQVTIDDSTLSAVYKDITDGISTLQTGLSVVQGQITAKVWQTDIDEALLVDATNLITSGDFDGYTTFGTSYDWYRTSSSYIIVTTYEELPCVRLYPTSSSLRYVRQKVDIPAGTYRVQMKLASSGSASTVQVLAGNAESVSNVLYTWTVAEAGSIGTSWETFTTTITLEEACSYFFVQTPAQSAAYIYITDIVLCSSATIADKYAELTVTVDGITSTVGNLETTAEGFASSISTIQQTMDSIKLSVSSSENGTATIQLLVGDAAGEAIEAVTEARTAFANESTAITISAGTVAFDANTLVVNGKNFTLDSDGNATFEGLVTMTSGMVYNALDVGGYITIYKDYITNGRFADGSYSCATTKGDDYWYYSTNYTNVTTYKGRRCLKTYSKSATSASYYGYIRKWPSTAWESGVTYLVKAKIASTSGTAFVRARFGPSTTLTISADDIGDMTNVGELTEEWQSFSCRITTTEEWACLYIYPICSASGAPVYITDIQVSRLDEPVARIGYLAGEWSDGSTDGIGVINDAGDEENYLIVTTAGVRMQAGDYNIYASTGGAVAWTGQYTTMSTTGALTVASSSTTSDRRLKHDIADLDGRYLKLLDGMNPVRFIMDADTEERYTCGYIAQDVQEAGEMAGLTVQENALAREMQNGYLSLNYTGIIPLLHLKIKELEARVQALEGS